MNNTFIIFIKPLAGEALRIQVQSSYKVLDIKNIIKEKKNLSQDISAIKLTFKGQELQNNQSIEETRLKQGDQVIMTVKVIPQIKQKQQHSLDIENLETGEQFKKAVDDLMELGYKREDVISALKTGQRNLRRSLQILINAERRKMVAIDEEDQKEENVEEQMQIDQLKFQALRDNPLVQKLIHSLIDDPEGWQETMLQIQTSNQNLYNEIIDNEQAFLQVVMESPGFSNLTDDYEIINQDDAIVIEQIQELNQQLSKSEIIRCYLQNNKDPQFTVQALLFNKSIK